MTKLEQLANNATFTALSRIAMATSSAMLPVLGFLFWLHISGIADDADAAVNKAESVDRRVASVEATVGTIRETQTRMLGDRDRSQDATARSIDKLTDVITEQGKQIAALAATIEALKARPR